MLRTPLGDDVFLVQSYTQYIPLPISDLDSWLKTPSIYVFDCSAAGLIVKTFIEVFNAFWFIFLAGISFCQCIGVDHIFLQFSDLSNFLYSFSFRVGIRLVDLPRGIASCLHPVKHMRLFLRVLNFLLMFSHHVSQHPSKRHCDGDALLSPPIFCLFSFLLA